MEVSKFVILRISFAKNRTFELCSLVDDMLFLEYFPVVLSVIGCGILMNLDGRGY